MPLRKRYKAGPWLELGAVVQVNRRGPVSLVGVVGHIAYVHPTGDYRYDVIWENSDGDEDAVGFNAHELSPVSPAREALYRLTGR